ncbi:phenylalanine--tRNA ligase subunit alpha [bacterium 3DAC]|jgi:phenylalanyl-tRNA synthetase alpha chain|nr:phenylalanine--tRNA ligase subunit alpha [Dictyoglomota bacterium]UZN23476.1 phenylalanine--tRNA ligase subunit alpha [bacterium 3DAC]
MDVRSIREELLKSFENVRTLEELEALRVRFLGKKGVIQQGFKKLKELPPEEKKAMGKLLNDLRKEVEERLASVRERLLEEERKQQVERERIDVTMPGTELAWGSTHILRKAKEELQYIARKLGFTIVDGPEVEDDFHNFEALNFPPYHPSRDMQDTLFLPGGLLLRTHTSAVQIRALQRKKPPVRIFTVGRVYRREEVTARKFLAFHQAEGLWIDKKVSIGHLKGVLAEFIKGFFGPGYKLRFRPSYFPFVEPGMEVDVECVFCGGKGCKVCQYSGWLEILGAGMVHPNVLRAVGYDPEEYTGFAFGMGVDRMVMLKYGINDIRLLFDGNQKFLRSV